MKLKHIRKEEAQVRQAERDARTPAQQLAVISTRRGASKREVARLTAEKEKA